jgi:5-deoxy-D-glucuronate isomerase
MNNHSRSGSQIFNLSSTRVFLSGYHPTVAAPGTTVCYLWALAGDSKAYNVISDPRFGWVSTAEAVIKEMQH